MPPFKGANFTLRMPEQWERHFGHLRDSPTSTPIVIGELGGRYEEEAEREWQRWALEYAAERGFGVFYFGLNPNSDDTGGLLNDDWTTPNGEKLEILRSLPSTDICSVDPEGIPAVQYPSRCSSEPTVTAGQHKEDELSPLTVTQQKQTGLGQIVREGNMMDGPGRP